MSSLMPNNIVVLSNAATKVDMLNAPAPSTTHETTRNGLMEESMLVFLPPNTSTALSVRASHYNRGKYDFDLGKGFKLILIKCRYG